jgi:diguanylate cyclase (GGDEF)-like protein
MSKFLYMTKQEMSDAPVVGRLQRYVPPVLHDTVCSDLVTRFLHDETLYALPVVNAAKVPVALVDRHSFIEFFSRPYTREVHGKKTITRFLKSRAISFSLTAPVIVDESTSIDDVAQIIIDAGMQHMVSGFIVTQNQQYLGIANGHDLLDEITQRKQADLYYLAHFDQLTEIPNRMLFTDRLTQACREALRNNAMVGLMFVDLDRFKQVNDTLGHRFADHLLHAVAARLQSCARDCDTVARLGGDEFAILIDALNDPEDADLFAGRIVAAMKEPFRIMDHELIISASIGIAIYPRDDDEVSTLLSKADAAMYAAKSNGRNGYCGYVPGLSMYSADRMSLETDLRTALAGDEFVLCYQPQVNLVSERVVGVEALIRWRHPIRGLLSPGQFISIAEESGLIIDIGHWVLSEACRQHQRWMEAGMPPLRMAVNMSSLQFRQADFSTRVKTILASTGIDPSFLELELTEGIVMHDAAAVLNTLNELKSLGLKLAVDDFGTGFSSLSYLRRFPIDRLKIDQSFVRGIGSLPVNESIVRAIAVLAQSLSLETVAEGTETETELAFVKACNCTEAQGYRYSRPLPADEFVAWMNLYKQRYVMRDLFAAHDQICIDT